MSTARTSYTELSTLAQCEMKWSFRYRLQRAQVQTNAMQLGSLLHAGARAFWADDSISFAMMQLVTPGIDSLSAGVAWDSLARNGIEPYVTADWLMDRYVQQYREHRGKVTVHSAEKKLTARIPGTSTSVRSYVDHLFEIDGKLWLVERKSMGDWSRLDQIDVDPQLTLYVWNALQNGLPVHGVMYDAIRTYRWKPEKPTQKQLLDEAAAEGRTFINNTAARDWARDAVERHPGVERPVSESFEQLWLDRSEEQMTAALEWAKAIINRRSALKRRSKPIRNIGPLCKGCTFREECYEGMEYGGTEFVEDVA